MINKSFLVGLVCGVVVIGVAWAIYELRITDEGGIETQPQLMKAKQDLEDTTQVKSNHDDINGDKIQSEKLADSIPQPSQNDPVELPESAQDLKESVYSDDRDPAWEYNMEQSIQQAIVSHRNSSQFDLFSIECDGQTCEVEVYGNTDEAWPAWQRFMYDLRQQLPEEFDEYSTSSTRRDGRLVLTARLRNYPD